MLWINESFVLDEAGNLIIVSYVDLRTPESRTPIQTLVKGCRREHALEDTDTILVSPPERFREEGENLIRDKQEGLAVEKTETVQPETPEEVFEHRRIADLNEAIELLDSDIRITRRVTSRSVKSSSKSLTFGRECWVFSTAIMPETEEEWAAWRATLDPAYDHESEIGQPAKFAEALGRMVTEQLGPQGQDGWMQGSIGEEKNVRTKHPTQLILHGPVVYTDRLYDTLAKDTDEAMRLAAFIFTKSATHAAQREYRFVILRDGTVDEKRHLAISGMMRDALQPGTSALVRPAPVSAKASVENGSSSRTSGSTKLLYQRAKAKKRVTQREETRWESRGPDGEILSSESELRESVHEKTLTRDLEGKEQGIDALEVVGQEDEEDAPRRRKQGLLLDDAMPGSETSDEDTIREIAFENSASSDRGTGVRASRSVGQVKSREYKSIEEMFIEQFNDPAFPTSGTSEPWAEEALSREEILKIYKIIATLAHKVTRVAIENRITASSACWHAIQCIRNIYARLGDIVDTVAIERERFVVIQMKVSEELRATGRIAVAPSGAYACHLKQSGRQEVSFTEGGPGIIFFPLSNDVEKFESFGWPMKDK